MVISASPLCIFPSNLMQDIFIQYKVIDIFPKFKMAAAAILDFQFVWIWPFRRVDSVVFVFCTKFGSKICYSHCDRHRPLFDDVTQINFRFRILVTWSSPASPWCIIPYNLMQDIFIQSKVIDIFPIVWPSQHVLGASSHEIWGRHLYPIRSYWCFIQN